MASFYSAWCGSSQWLLRLDVSESADANGTTYNAVLYCSSNYMTWRNSPFWWNISIDGDNSSGTNGGPGIAPGTTVAIASKSKYVAKGSTARNVTFTFSGGTSGASQSVYNAGTSGSGTLTLAAVATHTWKFDVNGGSGTFADITKTYGSQGFMPSTAPTRTGYNFTGWQGTLDGSTQTFAAGAECTWDADVTFYAQWSIITHTVSYSTTTSHGTCQYVPYAQTKYYGTILTLYSGDIPYLKGYTFREWNTKVDGTGEAYQMGGQYGDDADLVLYGQFDPTTKTVTYDANGGTGAPASQTKYYGTILTLSSTVPTRTNYAFAGWNTAKDGSGRAYAAGEKYGEDADVTMYAQWTYAYVAPTVGTPNAYRATSAGAASDTGTYARVYYSASSNMSGVNLTKATATLNGTTKEATLSATSVSGKYFEFSGLSTETAYTGTLSVTDGTGTTTVSFAIPAMHFHFDLSPNFGIGLGGIAAHDNATTVYGALYDESDNVFLPWQKIYPVGAVYLSYVSTSPASLFGGTWTQITGRFLRAATDTSTGGRDTIDIRTTTGEAAGYGLTKSGVFMDRVVVAVGDTSMYLPSNMPAYQDLYAWRRTA